MPDQTDDSNRRNRWAEDRTILANERTFSAWMGMGLGAVGVAIGLKAVFGATDHTWIAKLGASFFLGIAILIYWMAQRQARKTFDRLQERDVEAMPTHNYTLLASLMTGATIFVGGVLWSLYPPA